MKVAIVCDWLVTYAGAEKVLEQILNIFPEADIFALVDFLDEDNRSFIKNKKVVTSFIQKLPKAKIKYRNYLPLMPLAIEQLDVTTYDLVISSSHCVAKGVITGPNQIHISYVHSPIRYAWDLQHQYLKESGLIKGVKGKIAKAILHYMRMWDVRTANGVDFFAAVCDWAGIRLPEGLHGVSFRPLVEKADPSLKHQDYIVTETTFDKGGNTRGWALRTSRYKYVLYDKGRYREQLFDMEKDRGEMRNLAIEEKYKEILLQHREYLHDWMKLHHVAQIRKDVHTIPGVNPE